MIVAGFAERESTAAHCDCAAAGGSSCSGGRFDRAAEKSRQSESEARAGDNRCNLVRFPNPLAFKVRRGPCLDKLGDTVENFVNLICMKYLT